MTPTGGMTDISHPSLEARRRVLDELDAAHREKRFSRIEESDIRAALSSPPEQELRAALEKCAERFREYEQNHLDKLKGAVEVHFARSIAEKALRNREMAEMCERTLSPPPQPKGDR